MGGLIDDDTRASVREYTESLMLDAVLIQRPGSAPTFDETTGILTGMPNPVTVYTGKARIPDITPAGFISVGEGQIPSRQVTISVPYDTAEVRVDDVVTVTSAVDPALLRRPTWVVTGVAAGGAFADKRHVTMSQQFPSSNWTG